MIWDWTLVAETALAIALGIGAGGWFVVDRLEVAMLRVAAHPNVRKLANAADKFQGASDGGWPGLIGGVLNMLTGGRFKGSGGGRGAPADQLAPGEALVMNEQGEIVGKARYQ